VLFATLAAAPSPSPGTRALVEAAGAGHLHVGASPEEQWLGRLARFLFGPRGPEITGIREG
jgi:hypothetical protein